MGPAQGIMRGKLFLIASFLAILPFLGVSHELRSSIQINSGGKEVGEFRTDEKGRSPQWIHIIGEGTSTSTYEGSRHLAVVDDVPEDALKSHRWTQKDEQIRYRFFWLEDGSYECNFYFVETSEWSMSSGRRVLGVYANGRSLSGIDVYDEAGSYNALKKTISSVRVTNNELDIRISADEGYPSVNAISCHKSIEDTEDESSSLCKIPELTFNPTLGTCSENCEDRACTCFNEVEELMEFVFGRLMDELLRGEDASYVLDVDTTAPSEDLGIGISNDDPYFLEILECKTFAEETCPNIVITPSPEPPTPEPILPIVSPDAVPFGAPAVAARIFKSDFEQNMGRIIDRISRTHSNKYSGLQSYVRQETSTYCGDTSYCGIVEELVEIGTSSLAEFLYEINDNCIGDDSCWCKSADQDGLENITGSNGTDIIKTCDASNVGTVCPIIQKGTYYLELHIRPILYKAINGDSCAEEIDVLSRNNNWSNGFKNTAEVCKKKKKPKACKKMKEKIKNSVNQMKKTSSLNNGK